MLDTKPGATYVVSRSWDHYVLDNYIGRYGTPKYASVEESKKNSGFEVVLVFTDEGRDHPTYRVSPESDGFYLSELEEVHTT